MNYSLSDIPNSGKTPVVYMDISLNNNYAGKIMIRLHREIFPAAVENFVKIAEGTTYKIVDCGISKYKYTKDIQRTYENCIFYQREHNNYIVSGDIYKNNGSDAGTIYDDIAIPAEFGDFYFENNKKGSVVLIPYVDELSDKIYYDSTFMITLADTKPSDLLYDLTPDHITIGYVIDGLDILDKINLAITPYARKFPTKIEITKCGLHSTRPCTNITVYNKLYNRPLYLESFNNQAIDH